MKVDVCICTFRRSSILHTLTSIAAQKLPDNVALSVVVADNDSAPTIKDWLMLEAEKLNLQLLYVHAPAFNISIARNACLDNATGDIAMFIDDDEIAPETWVSDLLSCHQRSKASVVFGRSVAVYPPDAPDWMLANQFHSNTPTLKNGVVETGFSGNTLLDRSDEIVRDQRFDMSFGKTGGEDVEFFFRLHRRGVVMVICDAALVEEPVEPKRMSLKWLLKRKHAQGKIYGHCLLQNENASRFKQLAVSSAKSLYCLLLALFSAFSKRKAAFWLMRGIFHVGVASGAIAKPSREAYGAEKHES